MDTAFLIAIVDLNYLKDENRWLQKSQLLLEAAKELPWLKVQLRTKTPISEKTVSCLYKEYASMSSCHWNLSQPLPGPVAHRHLPEAKAMDFAGSNFSVSVHSIEVATKSQMKVAKWIQMAPIFEPTHKSGQPVGLSTLKSLCKISNIPVVAAGGITPDNVAQVSKTGVVGIASIGHVLQTQKPILAAQQLYRAFL
jgi:hypothetical protein